MSFWTALTNQQKVVRIIEIMRDLDEEDLKEIEAAIYIIREVRGEEA